MHNRDIKGFTLLEVLIAIVILALAFTTVFRGISTYARNLHYLEDKTAANWVALNIIAEAQLKINFQAEPKQQLMLGKLWYWNAVVKPTPNPYVSQIDVDVRNKDAKPFAHLTGYLRNTL